MLNILDYFKAKCVISAPLLANLPNVIEKIARFSVGIVSDAHTKVATTKLKCSECLLEFCC